MIEKMKHHPVWTAVSIMLAFYAAALALGLIVSLWWWILWVPGLALYFLCFEWNDRVKLLCPECRREEWNKTNYYCRECGVKLLFQRQEKVKPQTTPKPGRLAILCCSNGHEVSRYDKFCGKCGEEIGQ